MAIIAGLAVFPPSVVHRNLHQNHLGVLAKNIKYWLSTNSVPLNQSLRVLLGNLLFAGSQVNLTSIHLRTVEKKWDNNITAQRYTSYLNMVSGGP